MLIAVGTEVAPLKLGDPRLPWEFETILQGTLVSLAAGVPLGFVFWQVDALQASLGLPLTTATPDFGWRLLRQIPPPLRDPWAKTMWPLLHNERTEPWHPPEDRTVLLGQKQPLIISWLWRLLGLVWVPGRRRYRVRSLFHAELAEAAWLHVGAGAESIRARALDLADREKTIGSIRVATVAACVGTLVLNTVLWASSSTAAVVLALAVVAPSASVLLPFLVRRSAGPWWPVGFALAFAAAAVMADSSSGVLAILLATIGATCLVLLVVAGLAWWRLRPGKDWIAPLTAHYLPVLATLAAIAGAALSGPEDRLVLGASAPLLLLALAFCRVLNVNQRIVRQRRLALELSVFRSTDWEQHASFFRADP